MMNKLVVIRIGDGNFEQGFPVTLQIGQEGYAPIVEVQGRLPPNPEIPRQYLLWQSEYQQLGGMRIRVPAAQITNVSRIETCEQAAHILQTQMKAWLNHPDIRELREQIREEVRREDTARIILQTQNLQLQKLPWHLWDLLERRPNVELGLSSDYAVPSQPLKNPVRILAVLGDTTGIDVQHDRQLLDQLPGVVVTLLEKPHRQQFNEQLWNQSWDILFFAGHSFTQVEPHQANAAGFLRINDTDSLSLDQLRYGLKTAVQNGLKLAIFNSCDGLGLIPQIADLKIPHVILMREPVPDRVAQAFLRYFLTAFSQGESLHLSVRRAREQLQGMEVEYPCASWLPVICQNPAEHSLIWPDQKHSPTQKRFPLMRPIAVSLVALAALMGTVFWAVVRGGGSATPTSPELSVRSPESPARIGVSFQTFVDYAKAAAKGDRLLPLGTWRYGGSTAWAAIRGKVDAEIKAVLPQFQIVYTQDPVEPPSSGNGIEMLTEGRLAFSQASRPLTDEEIARATQRGFTLRQTAVAYDAIVAVVHPSLEVEGLTIEQLVGIYTGTITNWQQVGGPDLPILPYESDLRGGSPTILRSFFPPGANFSDRIRVIGRPSEAIRRVANPATEAERGGIYMASARTLLGQCEVKPLAIGRSAGNLVAPYQGERVQPEQCPERRNQLNPEVVITGQYPLARQLYVITREDNSIESKAGQAYAALLLTQEGQRLIQAAGFIPMLSF